MKNLAFISVIFLCMPSQAATRPSDVLDSFKKCHQACVGFLNTQYGRLPTAGPLFPAKSVLEGLNEENILQYTGDLLQMLLEYSDEYYKRTNYQPEMRISTYGTSIPKDPYITYSECLDGWDEETKESINLARTSDAKFKTGAINKLNPQLVSASDACNRYIGVAFVEYLTRAAINTLESKQECHSAGFTRNAAYQLSDQYLYNRAAACKKKNPCFCMTPWIGVDDHCYSTSSGRADRRYNFNSSGECYFPDAE